MKMICHSQQSKWSVGPERTLPLFAQQCKQEAHGLYAELL